LVGTGGAEAQLPKQGAASGTWHKTGTLNVYPVGSDILVILGNEVGYQTSDTGEGPFHNMSGRCVFTGQTIKGAGNFAGRCFLMDPAGDQFIMQWETTEAILGKRITGKSILLGGTGKFTGITGTNEWEASTTEVRPIADGTYQGWSKMKYEYRLP
jgi:hypothetical protein